jgi:hypothetical protein
VGQDYIPFGIDLYLAPETIAELRTSFCRLQIEVVNDDSEQIVDSLHIFPYLVALASVLNRTRTV